MKLLLDQDIYAATIAFLRSLGHNVVLLAELGLSRADDSDLLEVAQNQRRIFVTRDSDFGNLVFVYKLGAGVLYLVFYRLLPKPCMMNSSWYWSGIPRQT